MSDLGGGYSPQGSRPWHPGDPGYGGTPEEIAAAQQQAQAQAQAQQAAWQQQNQYAQGSYGQQQQTGWQQPAQQQYGQDPYAQQQQQAQAQAQQQQLWQQQAQQQQYGQQAQFGQQQVPQQQMPQQQGWQQGMQQGLQHQGLQQQAVQQPFGQQQMAQGRPVQPRPPVQQQRPAPAGPGPDGIDWEAEAAALENPRTAEPEPELWEEDGQEYPEGGAEPEHDSFLGEQDHSREGERKRKEKGKAAGRRNGGACLVVALVLLGGLGGAGWWGYGFYQSHFGPPADFSGAGTGSVSIEIKPGSGEQMGQVLQAAGVVKSVKAFYNAFVANPKANTIQPGAYTMHHQMSAKDAVALLVESNGGNALVIPEGKKAVDIYAKIDDKLKLNKGTTAQIAKDQAANLGLPAYANNNPEGFLYPAKYSITEGMKPDALLKQMVANAVQHYKDLNLDAAAQKVGLANGYQVVIEASILQAEGNNDQDFGKIARALYNRLNTNATQGKLQLDTTLQYKLGRPNFTKAEKEGDKSPYNTYVSKGLPPTPISNPGEEAIQAVLNPTPGDWVYFVALSATETRFSSTFDQFKKDVKDWCTQQGKGFDESGMCK
ncbi:endolytic transglycosylase MltG [Kitasatospora sp. NPDC002227]|uniref:endolytic transglycosylase MltG n=1 Tax=Kitasatospora sp. NPDC002227 TaxID=3154773 RepID=UPI00331B093A